MARVVAAAPSRPHVNVVTFACKSLCRACYGYNSKMTQPVPLLISELNNLLRLTQTEAMVAQTRRTQAASERIERELAQNAEKCSERAQLLTEAIRQLGSVPDVLGVALGRAAAVAKASLEQSLPLTEALFGDLALEHQLLDRTRFARMLAEQAGETKVVKVLDRLEVAHTATLDWLTTRLAEVVLGGPPALRPTSPQVVAGVARQVVSLPARGAAASVNRSVAIVEDLQKRAEVAITTNVDRARQLVGAAGEIWTAGRDATLERTEEVAREKRATGTAAAVRRTRRELGAVSADELPVRNYDTLNVGTAVNRIERLGDPEEVRTVLAYEAANKARKGVLTVAQGRLESLAAEMAAAS